MDIISLVLGSAKIQNVIENSFYFFIAWLIMRNQFDGLKKSISDVGMRLTSMEQAHAIRLSNLETDVKIIKTTITRE